MIFKLEFEFHQKSSKNYENEKTNILKIATKDALGTLISKAVRRNWNTVLQGSMI